MALSMHIAQSPMEGAVLAAALKPIFVSALVGILELIVITRVGAVATALTTVIIAVGKCRNERRAQCERGCG